MEFWDQHRTIISRYASGEDTSGFQYIQFYVAHKNNKTQRSLTLYINPNYTKGREENEHTSLLGQMKKFLYFNQILK